MSKNNYYKNLKLNEKKTILIGGSTEICGLIGQINYVLNKMGHECICIGQVYKNSDWFETKFDINPKKFIRDLLIYLFNRNGIILRVLNFDKVNRIIRYFEKSQKIKRLLFNQFIIKKIDTYIHIWDFEIYNKELFFYDLKKNGKELRVIMVGSDFTDWNLYCNIFHPEIEKYGLKMWSSKINHSVSLAFKRKMDLYEKYADMIFSVPSISLYARKPFYNFILPINFENFNSKINFDTKLKIVHIPSNSQVKGTDFILKIIKELELDWDCFEFQSINNIQQKDVFRILENSDILIDELIAPGPAFLSHEALCCGCLVLTHSDQILRNDTLLMGNYFFHIDFQNLKITLSSLFHEFKSNPVLFKQKYSDFIRNGFEYISTNNNSESVCKRFLEMDKNDEPDFYPEKWNNLINLHLS